MYSTGSKQHLYVSDPKLLRELKLHNSLGLGRPTYLSKPMQPLLGNGLIRANGHEWAYQRKLIAPEFFLDKVKVCVYLDVYVYIQTTLRSLPYKILSIHVVKMCREW